MIYVVDSSCSDEELQTSKKFLHEALCAPELRDLPLLVLANCQDKAGARTAKQVQYCKQPVCQDKFAFEKKC